MLKKREDIFIRVVQKNNKINMHKICTCILILNLKKRFRALIEIRLREF